LTDQHFLRINDSATVGREYESEERFLARRLTTWAELHGPRVEDVAVAALATAPMGRLLEIGCGTGDFTERVQRELGVDVVALDVSPRMVELTRARGVTAVLGSVEALPFADRQYDCVLANRVLYHVPDLARGLSEVVRVLRPGGRLIAITYSSRHLRELFDAVAFSPIAAAASADVSLNRLAQHFSAVARQDVTGTARFATTSAIRGLLDSFGGFSNVDLGPRLGAVALPFDATYRQVLYVARTHA
jgi:SAM-dependent methyltransferase